METQIFKIYLVVKIYAYSLLLIGISLRFSHFACSKLIEYFSFYCTFACFVDSIYLCILSAHAKTIVRSAQNKYNIFRYKKEYIVYYLEFCINLFINAIQAVVYLGSDYQESWIENVKSRMMCWNITVLVICHDRSKTQEHFIRTFVCNYLAVYIGFNTIRTFF
jgi:hypothetical protein